MNNHSFIEKRAYPRFPVMIPAACPLSSQEDKARAYTHDISVQGLGLALNRELPNGSEVEVVLYMSDNGEEINKKGTVIWSRKSNGNGYRAGIQLSGDDTLKPIPLVLRTIYKQRSN